MFLKRQNQGCNIRFHQKNTEKFGENFPTFFGENFPEFPENVLPKFPEISSIFNFLKDKIRAVTLFSSPENTGKSGGKFPGIFPEKIFRQFPEFSEFRNFPKFPEISRENPTKMLLLYSIKIKILALYHCVLKYLHGKRIVFFLYRPVKFT